MFSYSRAIGYMQTMDLINSFRVLYECFPRTLRTPLNSPYTPNTPNELNRVKHFEPLGLSSSLKEIDFNASQCSRRSRIEPIETLELLRGLYEQDKQDETLKGVNTFNMFKGV